MELENLGMAVDASRLSIGRGILRSFCLLKVNLHDSEYFWVHLLGPS